MPTRKWYKNRRSRLARQRQPKSRATWLTRWRRNLTKLAEWAADLWADRDIYNEYRSIVMENPNLDRRAEFFHLVDRMYLTHALLAIRRLDDTDLRSNSFYNLIEEVRDNVELLDRSWFIKRYRRESNGDFDFRR